MEFVHEVGQRLRHQPSTLASTVSEPPNKPGAEA